MSNQTRYAELRDKVKAMDNMRAAICFSYFNGAINCMIEDERPMMKENVTDALERAIDFIEENYHTNPFEPVSEKMNYVNGHWLTDDELSRQKRNHEENIFFTQ